MFREFYLQQVENLREQISMEGTRHREAEETTTCRLRAEEAQRCSIEERLEKAHADLQAMRAEHTCLAEYLVRLARALCWSECTEPPAHGNDTHILADSLLERAERMAIFFENHGGSHGDKVKHPQKNCSVSIFLTLSNSPSLISTHSGIIIHTIIIIICLN